MARLPAWCTTRLWNRCGPTRRFFLSQCCGYDLVSRYAGILRPLVTPRFTAPGCQGSEYCSQIVVGEGTALGDLAEARGGFCAVNGFDPIPA